MNEAFYKLEEDKKLSIINAGLEVFGKYGYKKASTDLIASRAVISKGLLFYYFKNKLTYFIYLFEYSQGIISNNIDIDKCKNNNDFFEILEYLTYEKCKVLKTYPHILNFITIAYSSSDKNIADVIQDKLKTSNVSIDEYFENIDKSKFKNDVDIIEIIEMLSLMLDGYIQNTLRMNKMIDIDEVKLKYKKWIHTLRLATYK